MELDDLRIRIRRLLVSRLTAARCNMTLTYQNTSIGRAECHIVYC